MRRHSQFVQSPRRILITPTELAGYYSNLRAGFLDIGQQVEFIDLGANHFNYGGSDPLPRVLQWRNELQSIAPSGGLRGRLCRLLAILLYSVWLTGAMFRYDAFIFSFGNSLLPKNRDLPLLRFLGKFVICNLSHGSEARPPYLDGSWYSGEGRHPGFEELARLTRQTKLKVEKCEKYASLIIGAPYSSSPFLSKPFVNMFAIGIPLGSQANLGHITPKRAKLSRETRRFRVLHSPSHPFVKGTSAIRNAVRDLRDEGFDLELVEVQNSPNRRVLEEIASCDFVVDQVFSDLPMAGFALEAAANGKPAIVGGEHLEELRSYVPSGMWPPTIVCKPTGLKEAIRMLLLNPQEIATRGAEARSFVEQKWRAEDVARRYLALLRNQVPQEWFLSPASVPFPREVGISSEEAAKNVNNMAGLFGQKGLGFQ